ncbi:SLATT domain-containing protein [Priestia aryabhattai]
MSTQQSKSGEKSSETNTHCEYRISLEAQIRECYGRVVYTHKTQEKCADLLLKKNSRIKFWQLLLSAVTAGTFLVDLFGDGNIATIIGALFSVALLVLNSYTQDIELVSVAEEHKNAAIKLWNIRENYLSLLTDFHNLTTDVIIEKRDELQIELLDIYQGSPRTNYKAYKKASTGLKNNEELTFSDEEIDLLLPQELRKKKIERNKI